MGRCGCLFFRALQQSSLSVCAWDGLLAELLLLLLLLAAASCPGTLAWGLALDNYLALRTSRWGPSDRTWYIQNG